MYSHPTIYSARLCAACLNITTCKLFICYNNYPIVIFFVQLFGLFEKILLFSPPQSLLSPTNYMYMYAAGPLPILALSAEPSLVADRADSDA